MLPIIVEDLLRHPLQFGWFAVANAPVRYRAIELGDVRYGWTVPPYLRPVAAGAMLPMHYAMVLRLSPVHGWQVEELKPFEWAEHAERWARGLWRDARAAVARSGGGASAANDAA